MTAEEFLDSLPQDMFADNDPGYCAACGLWACECVEGEEE